MEAQEAMEFTLPQEAGNAQEGLAAEAEALPEEISLEAALGGEGAQAALPEPAAESGETPEQALARAAREALGDRALELLQALAQRAPEVRPEPSVGPGAVEARVEALTREANEILQRGGVNMVEVLKADPGLRARVVSGEMDLKTAYGYHLAKQGEARPRVPAAVRGGANAGGVQKSIESMTRAEFERLDRELARGKRVYWG